MHGTVRGIAVRETTKCTRREDAEAVRIKREVEILEPSIYGGGATTTFLEAVVLYLENGGERRYVAPLVRHFGTARLARVDQSAIDCAAQAIYPHGKASTRNRQVYTPVSAILHFAAERGLCDYRTIKRPKQPKGRIRWLELEKADRLIDACSPHLKPLVTFLFYTAHGYRRRYTSIGRMWTYRADMCSSPIRKTAKREVCRCMIARLLHSQIYPTETVRCSAARAPRPTDRCTLHY